MLYICTYLVLSNTMCGLKRTVLLFNYYFGDIFEVVATIFGVVVAAKFNE